MKMFTLFSLLSLFCFSFTNQYTLIESEFLHKKIHLAVGAKSETKVILIDPASGSLPVEYDCTVAVNKTAAKILKDRPNGSEVFVIIQGTMVTDLQLCHEHGGVVIECGNQL